MARAIKRLRSTLGDTQQQFATRTGLATTTIARYETGWYPNPDVLAKLGQIARENNLPVFVEIFERDLPPEPYLAGDELPALRGLLQKATNELKGTTTDMQRGRVALTCLSGLSDAKLQKVSELLDSEMLPIEKLVEENAGIVSWNRDPFAEAKYLAFIEHPTLDGGQDYMQYALGEPYKIGFERSWLDNSPEAAIDFLKRCRRYADDADWAFPKDTTHLRRKQRGDDKESTPINKAKR